MPVTPGPSEDTGQPLVSPPMAVEPQWIDYNGHLNMAYYNVLFDRGVDAALAPLGLGPDYLATGASFFTAEAHVCYLRELHEGATVRATFQILDFDEKRIHAFQELIHVDGWTSATCELMTLHVDMAAKRVAPWPDTIRDRIADLHAQHARLPHPDRAGRSIGIRKQG